MAEQRPNILFFFTDQQRWDTCGCYGQKLPTTPNLDKMAEKGVKFVNAYTNQPVCGPARAMLQTGKYPTEVGCHKNHYMLPLDEPTVAKTLSASGYEVGYIGKWHLASYGPHDGANDFRIKPVPDERRGGYKDFWIASDTLEFTSHGYDGHMFDQDGFKKEFGEGQYRVDAQTDWLIEYLDTRTLDKPFFMFTSYIEPHHQNDHNCYEGPHGSKEKWKDYEVPGDLVGTEGDWRENYPDYLGCINSLDNALGRVMDKLEELGIADNTLIIFTSDHGSHFRTRNSEYKRSCHDGCLHIPMVLYGPGYQGGIDNEKMVSLVDLPATVLDAAGVTVPDYMQGHTLSDSLTDNYIWQDDIFAQLSESQCGRCVRTERWTYSVRAPEEQRHDVHGTLYFEDFLYDNHADPHQKNNLIEDEAYADIREQMKQRLLCNIIKANEPVPEIKPASAKSL